MDLLKRNFVNITGRGTQPMMFSHGYGCDQNMWRFIAPHFKEDFKIVLFDHVGSGRSDYKAYDPEKYRDLQGYADDILELCEALSLTDVIFVGHSVSATIGILAAVKKPEIFSSLIHVAPSPCYINDGDYIGGFTRTDIEGLLQSLESNYLGWSSQMAPVIMGNAERPELGEELTNSFCRTDPDIAKHFARTTFLSDHRKALPLLKVPSLILQCSEDVIAPNVVGEYLKDHTPLSQLMSMKARGHCPHLSEPEETVACIKHFLNQ